MVELIAIGVLGGLLAWQNFFWMKVTRELTNKLMSRDFTEYKHAESPPPPPQRHVRAPEPDEDLGIMDQIGLR